MYYGFDAHPLIYVAAALAIFGMPMVCIYLAAMRSFGNHSQQPQQLKPPKTASPLRLPVASVVHMPVPVKKTRITRKRALKIEWISLPVDQDKI